MSLAFNPAVTAFSGHRVRSRREILPGQHVIVQGFPMITNKSSFTVKCNLTTTDLMGKIAEKFKGQDSNFPAAVAVQPATDIPSNLCIIDTLQRLGVDRYFQSEIDIILEDTYRLWQRKEREIFSDITIHVMAFRLLRVKGYEVLSEELAPYADQERIDLQAIDVSTVIELYRAAQERIDEEESSLEKLHAWTTAFLKQQLLTNSIPDKKLHKLVESYLKNYHGILDRMGVRLNLDLYGISHYQTLNRFSNLRTEDFLAFTRQDFNICQAQHQKELQLLQRWYADCRLDTLKYGRDVVRVSNFLTSAIFGDPELSDVRLVFAKHIVLVTRIDDFFDHGGSREESYKILDLIKEWKEKPAAEYGSEEVEILFTAVYNTVNGLAEMAHVEQGRSVKEFLIKLWVQILSIFKIELDTWTDDTALTLDDYLASSWVSIGCRICILMSMQFIGIKLSDEMLLSEECTDLCRHVSMVDRLLNDVQTFEKERKENTGNSVSLLLAANKDDSAFTEEEAITKAKKMAECNRRQLMQIVYKTGTIFPRKCKDMFLKVCRIGCYLYSSGDEFTSPQQMMEDMKSLVYEPLTVHPLEAKKVSGK
uniref:Kaurene synthase-like 1 n=1 Tax=Rosmarinus officinalis TaxID=39367 RepID=W8QMF8_ROSOF|nr:kaurene synthase-like 1 [Salvia rosmarinus]